MTAATHQDADQETLRIDKWLWHARFFKSRTLAAKFISEGKLRVNQIRISKAARSVQAGDILTFVKAERTYVIEIKAMGTRRGPAPEAQALYDDITPDEMKPTHKPQLHHQGLEGKKPTKKERRQINTLKSFASDYY